MKCEPITVSPNLEDDQLKKLPLMEAFYSIQGEGFHQGAPAYFIRLAGCDVGCHWCDVKESWNETDHPYVTVDEIIGTVSAQPTDKVIVTGGEPLMHNLEYLCNRLYNCNKSRHLETSGAHPLSGEWDWVCLSPKKFKAPLPEIYKKVHELKVVIYNKSDFSWAESFVPKLNSECKLFLQPEWSKCEEIMPQLIDYVKRDPKWSISLQIHKYMNVP